MTMPNVLANGPGNVPDAEELMANFDYLEGKIDDNLTDVDARLDAHDVSFMGKNLVMNGTFAVNQRGLTTAADDVYHLDRWYVLTETGSVTIAQQTDQESGQPTNIRLTQPDATAKRIGIAQIVESINCRHLRGQAVTLSAKVRCSISQPINIAIVEWAGTADSVTSDIVTDWTKGDYDTPGQFFIPTITYNPPQAAVTPSAATWTNVTVSGTLGASMNNLIVFVWTAGTLAQSATLDIGKVQLEAGSSQTAFERISHGLEIERCHRYFQKSYDLGTAVGAASSSAGRSVGLTVSTSDFYSWGVEYLITAMRGIPTVTIYNYSTGGTGTVYDTIDATSDAASATDVSEKRFRVVASGTLTSGHVYTWHWTASSEL